MKKMDRRGMLESTAGIAGAAFIGMGASFAAAAEETPKEPSKLKVLVVGAHPDDPETGCGGTIARYADLGHEVVSVYFTRGEAGIHGKSHTESAAIRTAEAENACKILKARPVFAGQIDGSTEINAARYDEFLALMQKENPDICFTHWPIDTHRDHRITSLMVYDAWQRMNRKFSLYYFEVETGMQSQNFHPTDYVDITEFEARKREACFAHDSQHPDEVYKLHDAMNRFRGMEFGCKFAEAFVRHAQSARGGLP